MNTGATFALPTEPLLERQTGQIAERQLDRDSMVWLAELAGEGDLISRSRALFESLRKRLGSEQFDNALEGLLISASEGQPDGVATLASMLAVRAPGAAVIESVREFRHLHRAATRLVHRRDSGEELVEGERELLAALESIDAELADHKDEQVNPEGLPSPLDLGPARVARRAFGALVGRLESRGNLDEASLRSFARLARAELQCVGYRASQLAESINPYSARAVSKSMPLLATLDTEVRDLSAFLDALEQRPTVALFHQQHPLLRDLLEPRDAARIIDRIETQPRLLLLRRLLGGLDRNPIPGRALAYFVHQLMRVGLCLSTARARRGGIDPLEAALLALEFCQDGQVRIPLGSRAADAMKTAEIEGVAITDGMLCIDFDPSAARRVHAPLGLPLPPQTVVDGEEELDHDIQNLKDLVMSNINNTSVLLGLLKNQKVVTTPGIVALIALSCRSARVVEIIATTRALHSGFANKDVPAAIVRSPVRLPVKMIRRFIHVKYINKVDLRRMSKDKSGLRREIHKEINEYLQSLS